MAKLTLQELIAQKSEIEKKKSARYEITTSIGEIICVTPDAALYSELLDSREDTFKTNCKMLYSCCVEPDLTDGDLRKVYGCFEPTDIVAKIFLPGEISKICDELMRLSGFRERPVAKLVETVEKN